jgi:choline dehydrogenase
VLVQSGNKEYYLTAKKEVIVSAGVFQSPQLLMVSGVGPAATLRAHGIPVVADLPGVGQNMWDHVLFGPSYRLNVITTSALANPTYLNQQIQLFNTEAGGILSSQGGDLLAFEKLPHSYRQNLTAATRAALADFPSDWPELEYLPVSAYFGPNYDLTTQAPTDGYQYSTIAAALVAPLSRGNVTISSADTNGELREQTHIAALELSLIAGTDLPVVNPNWLTDPADVEVAVAAFKRARELYTSPALQEITIGPEYFPGPNVTSDADILALIRKAANTVFHGACTCVSDAP